MFSKLKLFFAESWLLMISSVFFGGLLAITNTAWSPKIAQNEINKFNTLAQSVLTTAQSFKPLDKPLTLELGKGKTLVADVREGLDAGGNRSGWVFVAEGPGFADVIRLVVAVDAKFEKVYGFSVLSCSETPGFGDKITIKNGFYQSQYQEAPAGEFKLVKTGNPKAIDNEIVAITGATVTSQAVVNIMNTFVVQIKSKLTEQGLLQ
jgi:electron transport complex protein RnfG